MGRIHMILNGEPLQKDKNGKVFYGQEPPSGESTTTECGVNYQLLAVITEVAHWRTPSCSQPQLATYSGVRDGRSNDWSHPPPSWAVPRERLVHGINQCNLSRNRKFNRSLRSNHLAYAATQGGCIGHPGLRPSIQKVKCLSTWDRKWQLMKNVKGMWYTE